MTRDELMAQALAWHDEAHARVLVARKAHHEATVAAHEAQQRYWNATSAVERCQEAILAAAGGQPYMMGGELWFPKWPEDAP